jgi:hypothetical protein
VWSVRLRALAPKSGPCFSFRPLIFRGLNSFIYSSRSPQMRALIFFLIDTYIRDLPVTLLFPTHRSPFPSLGTSGYDHKQKRHTFLLAVIF